MINAEEKFLFLGNEPAVDLLNTTPVLAQGPVDFLEDFADLTAWISAAGLLEESKAKALRRRWHGTSEADAAVAQAKQLREALREVLAAKLSRTRLPARAMGTLNEALGTDKTTSQLEWDEKAGTFIRTVHHDTDGTPAQAVTLLAEAAARLLTEKDLALVRRCENPACVLHFYDTSKNHRRRWCSMDICGNRMKVAAHYRRQRDERR
jgi:predicted RNA-binding Zn ribbon-like protein